MSILERFAIPLVCATVGWLIAFGIRAWYRAWVSKACHGGHKKKYLRLDLKSNIDCGNSSHAYHDSSEWWATLATWVCEEPGCNEHGVECFGTEGWWAIEHGQMVIDQKKMTDPPPMASPKQVLNRKTEGKATEALGKAHEDRIKDKQEVIAMLTDIKHLIKYDVVEPLKAAPPPQAPPPQPAPAVVPANLEERVIELISTQMAIPMGKITRQSAFVDDLGCDSLDVVELVMTFEDEYNLAISDNDAAKIRTVDDAIKYLEGAIAKGGTH
jgi:acyl carrier protein